MAEQMEKNGGKSSVLKSTLVFLAILAGICLVGYFLF